MENKLLSKRMNFNSMQSIADDYGARFAKHFNLSEEQEKEMIHGLFQVLDIASTELAAAARKGAERGINEAFALIFDPDFHETVKRRNQQNRERSKQWREEDKQREAERERRRNSPTREEKISDIRRAVWNMSQSRKTYHGNRDLIMKFVEQDGSEILGDFIKNQLEMPDLVIQNFDVDAYVKSLSECDIEQNPKKKTLVDEVEDFFDKNDVFSD